MHQFRQEYLVCIDTVQVCTSILRKSNQYKDEYTETCDVKVNYTCIYLSVIDNATFLRNHIFLTFLQKYPCKGSITIMSLWYALRIFLIFQLGKYHIKARFLRYLVEKNAEYVTMFPPNFYMILFFFNISNIDVSACTVIDLKLWYWCVRL